MDEGIKVKRTLFYEFVKGLYDDSPTFRQLLGMCPTLAVTVSTVNGFAMGAATAFVLLCSSTLISFVRKLIPEQVRIAAYVVIIAGFVTVADLYLRGNFPAVSKALGPFVPLIVVNCIILGRAEAFASKHPPLPSFLDALGNGLGFTLALVVLGTIRGILGSGMVVMILPTGAFVTLGLLIGFMNMLKKRRKLLRPVGFRR